MPPFKALLSTGPAAAQQLFSDWMKVHLAQAAAVFFTPIVFIVTTFTQSRDDCLHFPEAKIEEEIKEKRRKEKERK